MTEKLHFIPPIVAAEKVLTAYLKTQTKQYLTLTPVQGINLPIPIGGREYTLYAHIPYCESLCPYCSFNRFVYKEENTRKYFNALREEMKMVADLGYRFKTLYFGGGTPTIMLDELLSTIELARSLFPITEVSCETNPNHLIPEKIDALQGRVQRLSVGVQSFDDGLLRQVQRLEKYGSGEQILRRLEAVAGYFPSLNLDLIFNFPSQTQEILQSDIQKAISSVANQVTFYPLMTSPLVRQSLDKTVGTVRIDNEYQFYRQIQEGLDTHFTPKSAWTFARKGEGLIDEYIVDGNDYVGAGSGAFSFLDGTLYVNSFSLHAYSEALANDHIPLSKSLSFSNHNRMRYHFLMSLFGLSLDKADFKKRFGIPLELALPVEMAYLGATGSFSQNDSLQVRLTPKGRYMTLVMMREFFSNMDKIRQQARLDINPEEILECQRGAKGFATSFQIGNKFNE